MGRHSSARVPQGLAVLSPLISANGRLRAGRQHKHTIVYLALSCQNQRSSVKTGLCPQRRQTNADSQLHEASAGIRCLRRLSAAAERPARGHVDMSCHQIHSEGTVQDLIFLLKQF